ncbi:calcium/sodium antiporter [Hydrogenophilus thiooxidans]|uniref:calcium/sodium antiporter n=1 Tax=Hydrogenophilus thiooxidans TaxID=2820326 RepID=UPI001C24FD50|nr:calcium/sodium antiporter [Hydrogenophilus thiooxidans]
MNATSWMLLIAGLVILSVGADLLVRGGAKLAVRFGISPLVVGLTIIAYGTSAPELAVSVGAALKESGAMAVGNIVGSNIVNILIALGLSALIAPVTVHLQVIRQELPVLLGTSVLFAVTALDGTLSPLDGALLTALIIGYTIFLVRQSRLADKAAEAEFAEEIPKSHWDDPLPVQIALIVGGLALLVWGSDLAVSGAVAIAKALGVSEVVIGLTIVAVGTSLPEIATSLMAVYKGERDMAVGNVIGSNVFNLLAVGGASALAATPHGGLAVPVSVTTTDLWVMLGATLLLLPVVLSGYSVNRREGALLVALYIAYLTHLVLDALHHPALAPFRTFALGLALPLIVAGVLLRYLIHASRETPPS